MLIISSTYGSLFRTGDIEKEADQYFLESQQAEMFCVDKLVLPHHGSKTSFTSAFVEVVAPNIAISTKGYLNHFMHPRQEVVARYETLGASNYQTDHIGAFIIDFAQAYAIEISRWRVLRQRYWHDLFDAK